MDHNALVKIRELRLLLGKIGLDFPATYDIKPLANKSMIEIKSSIKYDDVVDFVNNHLKAKVLNGQFAYKNAILKIHDTQPVAIEILNKISEMRFIEYLNIV